MYYDRGIKAVLVYAPRNEAEIEIVKTIVIKPYEYATGKKYKE